MKIDYILTTIKEGCRDAARIWRDELLRIIKDEGVIIFFFVVPLVYPLLYSWIYNNEVVREVPVVVVDNSHSQLSRKFIRMCNASPDVKVVAFVDDVDEAKMLIGRNVAMALYYIPSDFQTRIYRMEQATISVYCDMSLVLCYKAAYQTALMVSQEMNSEIQIQLSGKYTKREEQIQAMPLEADGQPLFSPAGGYGSFVLPAVLMLIVQQTLVLGIGLSAGTVGRYCPREQPLPEPGTPRSPLLSWHVPRGVWQGDVLPDDIHPDGCMAYHHCTAAVPFPLSGPLARLVGHHAALYAGLHLLWHDGELSGTLS